MILIQKKLLWYVPIALFILLLLLFFIASYSKQSAFMAQIKARGEIVVVTRNAPTTYYERHNGQFAGIEYDMVTAFAQHLGVKPRFIIKDTVDEILTSIKKNEADFAAAGLTMTELRGGHYLFGPTYQEVRQYVICRRDNKKLPKSIEMLPDIKLLVSANTSYVERLQELQKEYPKLQWSQQTDWDTELILEKVWQGKLDCTVADSNIFDINRRYYPELTSVFPISEETPLAWVMPKPEEHLRLAIYDWFSEFKSSGKMEVLLDRYFGHLDQFDYVDTQRYIKKIKKTLPKYRKWFQQAAKKHRLDWTLLAAQSYQESHWNPRAKSPTGVRGMMMLTLPTARQLGVKSRLDAKSNIFAGAQYLANLRKRLPKHINEPERTWMALAAYNLGYGHLRDARKLTKQQGKNPDKWIDLESTLPLLSQKRHYRSLTHGYARGSEAVDYVNQVRDYRDILAQSQQKKKETKKKQVKKDKKKEAKKKEVKKDTKKETKKKDSKEKK